MKQLRLQPAPKMDGYDPESGPRYQLPYPFFVNEEGYVGQQDLWHGDPFKVIGFQRDLAQHTIDVWWDEVWAEPELAKGLYVVTIDQTGDNMGVHQLAIDSVESFESTAGSE